MYSIRPFNWNIKSPPAVVLGQLSAYLASLARMKGKKRTDYSNLRCIVGCSDLNLSLRIISFILFWIGAGILSQKY
jgi:hypothetical protein